MARPAPEVPAWASAVLGSEVTVLRSLRLGGTPWLLRADELRPSDLRADGVPADGVPADGRNVVLRVIAARRAGETETEVAAMTHVARVAQAGLPVPELLGYDLAEQTGYALVLTGQVAGSGVIPAEPDPERLRALGAVAARISSVTLSPTRALPVRYRPIEAEDFARLRREQGAGRPARDVPYWDVVASLSSPPDMGWFPESMAAQGRPDLTQEIMLERRDAFLAAALSQLGADSY